MELDTNCKTCELDGATYIGHWGILNGCMYHFELDDPIELGEDLWHNPLPVEDHDLSYDDNEIYRWTSAVQGEYSPIDEELHE
jgi:hypothetical protein